MRTHSRASRGVREPGEVSGFNRTNDLLSGEGQIAPLIRNKSSARFPHLGVSMQGYLLPPPRASWRLRQQGAYPNCGWGRRR
jgi:hypothetical protein